jgi:galactokinase
MYRVAIATLIEQLLQDNTVSKVEKAVRCQKAEHDFADVPCGIMDQYISSLGEPAKLLLIDCRSRDFKAIPFAHQSPTPAAGDSDPVMLVINSNVHHQLSGSEYPDRVKQCRAASQILHSSYANVSSLRDATMTMLNTVVDQMSTLVYHRAKHVIEENDRTLATVAALEKGDYKTVGVLMVQSHISLKTLYEVSCEELDLLVDLALQVPGVYGSRMTGGGFGGCTISLVERGQIATARKFISDQYFEKTGKKCDCYVVEPSAGAGRIDIPAKLLLQPAHVSNGASSLSDGSSIRSSGSNTEIKQNRFDWLVPAFIITVTLAIGARHLFGDKST